MLDKYKVDAKSDNFALFVVRDNGGKSCVPRNTRINLHAVIRSSIAVHDVVVSRAKEIERRRVSFRGQSDLGSARERRTTVSGR